MSPGTHVDVVSDIVSGASAVGASIIAHRSFGSGGHNASSKASPRSSEEPVAQRHTYVNTTSQQASGTYRSGDRGGGDPHIGGSTGPVAPPHHTYVNAASPQRMGVLTLGGVADQGDAMDHAAVA